jgi:glycosyltransferase involved in cell wall biosynthesis
VTTQLNQDAVKPATEPLKLLMVSESYWPNLDGGATFQHRLALGLAGRGHHVVVWAPSRPTLRSYIEHDGATTVYRERAVPLIMNTRYWVSLWPFWHAFRIMRRERPDVVHLQTPTQIGVAALIAARWYRVPVVATSHVMPENLLGLKLPRWLFRGLAAVIWRYIIWFHNRADAVTAPSPTALSYLQQHRLKPPAQAVSNGLDLATFRPATKPPVNRPPVLLYLGRLDAEKNVRTLVDAANILHQTDTDFQLEVVGTGTQLEALRAYASELGLGQQVHFRGRVSEAAKLRAYQSADIFVIASPAELQSIVTLEAMATGKPVVAAKAGALPDLVHDGVDGYLVPTTDAAAFANACRRLLTDTKLRQRLGQASLEMVRAHHSTTVTFATYEQLYLQVLAKKGGRPAVLPESAA